MDKNYYKGSLHTHTFWSDGRAFPEEMVNVYKSFGFDFICQTDHNVYPDNPAAYRKVHDEESKSWPPQISRASFDRYIAAFHGSADVQTDASEVRVRLKTVAELKEQFDCPGKFLIIGGNEISSGYPVGLDGTYLQVHVNYINLPLFVKTADGGSDIDEIIRKNYDNVTKAAKSSENEVFVMLNHPYWPYFDIMPSALIRNRQYRHFEISNPGGSQRPIGEFYSIGKFFDIVNAFRIAEGNEPICAAAADDAHLYFADLPWVDDSFVMVRATELTSAAIIRALNQGDYYASSGVLFDEIAFDREDKMLRVKIKAAEGVKYRIRFLTTRNDFDRNVELRQISGVEGRPTRISEIYSDEIGVCVAEFDSTQAECHLDDEMLYLRAEAVSDKPSRLPVAASHAKNMTAWTQVFTH